MRDEDATAAAIGYILGVLIVAIFVVLGCGYLASSCWNKFAPDVLGLGEASWRQGCFFVAFAMVVRVGSEAVTFRRVAK